MQNEIKKVLINYKMLRGDGDREVAETCIDLPISSMRYNELAADFNENCKAWHEIRGALEQLTLLQNYDKLGAWSIELKIETEDI